MNDPRYIFHQVSYQAITPIHVGSGQDVGIVDLPVIRERTTDHPYLPGSGIRGALRDRAEGAELEGVQALVDRLFGPESADEPAAGCVSVLDAHLVLFPVRSVPGVYRFVTSPFVLRRWASLRRYFLGDEGPVPVPAGEPEEGRFAGVTASNLHLEEYPFQPSTGLRWQWPADLLGAESEKVVLLHDTDFLHFVRAATLVRQRNHLSTGKTVLQGQLFSVEAVPAESRLVGFLGATDERQNLDKDQRMTSTQAAAALRSLLTGAATTKETHVVLGGDESVGWGVTKMVWEAS